MDAWRLGRCDGGSARQSARLIPDSGCHHRSAALWPALNQPAPVLDWATEATLNTVMLACDLMRLLRQVLLTTNTVKHTSNTVRHTLQTLRYKSFAKPAYITTESRKSILHLAMAMQRRAWMQGLVGCRSNLRFARSVFSRFFALRVLQWKISIQGPFGVVVLIEKSIRPLRFAPIRTCPRNAGREFDQAMIQARISQLRSCKFFCCPCHRCLFRQKMNQVGERYTRLNFSSIAGTGAGFKEEGCV